MSIDFNKPVQTRDGRKVRILCTDGPSDSHPVIGLISACHGASYWTANGAYDDCGASRNDLINVPERVERWMNVYGPGDEYENKAEADENAAKSRIATVRITYEDGKPVAVALEDV